MGFNALLMKIRRPDYLCGDFVVDAWEMIKGKPLPSDVCEALKGATGMSLLKVRHRAKKIESPTSPCLVTFWRIAGKAHIGIYDKGDVIHLGHDTGQCIPLSILKPYYSVVSFYEIR